MLTIAISNTRLSQLQSSAIVVAGRPAQFAVTGPGAVQCVQGITTNDIVKPGPSSLVYGALLTPKGMIIADCWVLRPAGVTDLILVADGSVESQLADLLRRQFPPRVARVTNRTAVDQCLWVVGPQARDLIGNRLGHPVEPGRVSTWPIGDETVQVAAPGSDRAPFSILILGSAGGCLAAAAELAAGDAELGTEDDLVAARVLGGFPALGAEIDARTMPAEVDYGGIGGVSHGKGCYVGQETVARLHFRGHPNWLLRRVRWSPGTNPPPSGELLEAGKVVVRIGSVLQLEDGSSLGLAKVRREIEPGTTINGVTIESLPAES